MGGFALPNSEHWVHHSYRLAQRRAVDIHVEGFLFGMQGSQALAARRRSHEWPSGEKTVMARPYLDRAHRLP